MAMKKEVVAQAFTPYLEPGETLEAFSYGVKQPHILLIIALFALAILPGAIATALLTKHYIVGLTNRRLIVLRIKGSKMDVIEVVEYLLSDGPRATSSTGPIFTHISILDPAKPFKAKFHRAGMSDNRANAMRIAAALTAGATDPTAIRTEPGPQGLASKQPVAPPPKRNVAQPNGKLVLKIGPITRRLAQGMAIEPQLLGSAGAGRGPGAIAEICSVAGTASSLGLRNLSDRPFGVKQPAGATLMLEPGQTATLSAGLVIDFGGIEGVVQASA